MKTKAIVFSLIFSLIMMMGFKSPQTNKDVIQIDYADIVIKCSQMQQQHYVVNNDKEYQEILSVRSPHPDCGDYVLPPIKFDKYTLLGFKAVGGGCGVSKMEHFITKNTKNDTIELNANISTNGICKKLFQYTVWCLIPKVEDSNLIKFKTNETHIDGEWDGY